MRIAIFQSHNTQKLLVNVLYSRYSIFRSLKERHDNEMQKLRLELDSANSAARDKEQDLISVRN